MIVFNAGVPRSGTVLVNAILRLLYEDAGLDVSVANPHGHELPELLEALIESGHHRQKITLIHTHSWDPETAHLVNQTCWITGFVNRRDPRDVCVSLMGLHDLSFEEAVDLVLESFADFRAMLAVTRWPVIDYEILVSSKLITIGAIAAHLGFRPSTESLHRIDADTSIETHSAIMEKIRTGEASPLIRRENERRTLYEHAQTLINDRHIQSGKSGRWQSELDPNQQAIAKEVFADLISDNHRERGL